MLPHDNFPELPSAIAEACACPAHMRWQIQHIDILTTVIKLTYAPQVRFIHHFMIFGARDTHNRTTACITACHLHTLIKQNPYSRKMKFID